MERNYVYTDGSITDKYDTYEFVINYKKETEQTFSCHIPAYSIYFSVMEGTIEDIRKRAKVMVHSFFYFNDKCFKAWEEVNKEKIASLNSPEKKKETRDKILNSKNLSPEVKEKLKEYWESKKEDYGKEIL